EPRLGETRNLRFKQRFESFLAGGRHGRQCPPMEAAFEGDDFERAGPVQGAVFAGELDRALIGLRARIGEEHLIEAALLDQCPGELEALYVVEGRAWRQQ